MRNELSDFIIEKFMSTKDDELALHFQDNQISMADEAELMRTEQPGYVEVCGICNMGYIYCEALN